MFKELFQILPDPAKEPAKLIIHSLRYLLYIGKGRWCPVCEKTSRKFRTAGSDKRKDVECTRCGALERHRFVWLYFGKMTNLFDKTPKKMLHVKETIGKGLYYSRLIVYSSRCENGYHQYSIS
jgi:hypothetical protein